MQIADDLGFRVELERPPSRIVSLVPSWTETLFALGFDSEVVGVTKFCVEPVAAVASIPKVGGTKNPDIAAIVKLEPELVIANAEENRREDVERMRAAGYPGVHDLSAHGAGRGRIDPAAGPRAQSRARRLPRWPRRSR